MSRGDYIHTYSGKKFYAMDPTPDDIDITDIAHALSHLCRFGGHTPTFYSVAEHSILVSELVPVKDRMWGLLHDASEAYLCDIPRPFKQYLNNYKEIEENIQRVIAVKFKLDWPIPPAVHFIDRNIVAAEAKQLWTTNPEWANESHWVPLNIPELYGFKPSVAKHNFLQAYLNLVEEVKVA